MDLLSFLIKCRDVQQLLSQYPETLWPRVVRAVMLYGFFSLKVQGCGALPVEVLEEKVRRSGYYIQVEGLLPALKQQLAEVKSELQHLDPPSEPSSPPKPPQDAFRKDFPSFKQPAKRTLVFQDPVQPLRNGANYNVVMRPNDMWGHEWSGEDYTKEVYPDWWLDMGKMGIREKKEDEELITVAKRPEPKKRLISQSKPPAEPEEMAIEAEVEDIATQVPSLHSTQAIPNPQQRSRANYSGWVGDFSQVVKRSPSDTHVHLPSSDDPLSVEEPVLMDAPHLSSQYRRSDAQRTLKADEASLSSKSSGPAPRFEVSSGSSMSTYRPSEEMKRFYQGEYSRFAGSGGTSMGSSGAPHKENPYPFDPLQSEFS